MGQTQHIRDHKPSDQFSEEGPPRLRIERGGTQMQQNRLNTLEAAENPPLSSSPKKEVKKAKIRKFMAKQKRENKWKEQREKQKEITQTVRMQENLYKLNQFVENQKKKPSLMATIDVKTLKK
jgi:hypothetical protein